MSERGKTAENAGDMCDLRCQSGGACGRKTCTGAAALAAEAAAGEARRRGADTPVKRAATAALDLCDQIDALPGPDAARVVEVLKQRIGISMLAKIFLPRTEAGVGADPEKPRAAQPCGWRDPAADGPDAEMNALVRRRSDEYPVSVACWSGHGALWLETDGNPIDDVTGWMDLEDAASALDQAFRIRGIPIVGVANCGPVKSGKEASHA